MTSKFPERSLTRSFKSPRTLFNTAMTVVAFICGVLVLVPLVAVLTYIIIKGFSSLELSVFTELPPPPLREGGGFGNAILGTLIMVSIAALISIPFGVLAAIYLTEFSTGKIARVIRFATNVLSGVPSIIAGVFAYGIVVLGLVRLNLGSYSALGGGFALAILMLPIIVKTTDEALQLVSQDLRQASLGLGATNFQTVTQIVLPAALPAIVTGSSLAIARASGETAPLLFTALFSQFWPSGLLKPTPSLAVLVYNFAISPFDNWQSLAWAASLVLVLMVLITSILARWATRQKA
ncbi:phosphate ABC transporter permease PstA [Nodularia spumigena CS-584]|uniref:Phosphate transport system permease protein PstA n=2 Tax=Nodularia spumigena TaxID=70799 RepID=A0A2S0Q9I4_NODSP|nr:MULTISPECIES: phosphate ABC transporter permease PstA [Cyanophyceae]MDB9355384.1 phosphate ABC transporter permease PstA [Nodularia spumigena CS-587/03]AHJ31550.1 Phosphate transport system permease protein PstA [Nodularia spumigena CCY9414]AVZ31031.1 phosphate transport system permease protein PstA [Nodularia spumigena UHCC 0039]EAW46888.1 Phosphate transport system permease protein 2 [Nodularia spumigena CCY9414]KZL51095.1 phosphate ABC transporter, permease protein PstA [Nodularia spumig